MILSKLVNQCIRTFTVNGHRNRSTNICAELQSRGLIEEFFPSKNSDQINEILQTTLQRIYAGFDPTADSLHVGNLLIIMGLLRFQRAGHHPIALVGGATGKIGDPSGRSTDRPQLSADAISHNIHCIQKQLKKIFKNHEKYFWNDKSQGKLNPVRFANNAEWYENMSAIDFVSDLGRNFRISKMLQLTSVKSRMETDEGITFAEFAYQMFQSYDWLQLLQKYECNFQLGGSDQLGNMSAGYHLIKRITKKSVYGVTMPLLTTRAGDKYGKSAGNAVWLDAKKTTPFSLYQFFLRSEDDEIEKLLQVLTFMTIDEIRDLMNKNEEIRHLRKPQETLAKNLILLIHGEQGLEKAKQVTAALYDGDFNALASLTKDELISTFNGAEVHNVMYKQGLTAIDLALETKMFKHQREAQRLISEGGFYINQNRCQNINEIISPSVHIMKNGFTLLRKGKRNYFIVNWLN